MKKALGVIITLTFVFPLFSAPWQINSGLRARASSKLLGLGNSGTNKNLQPTVFQSFQTLEAPEVEWSQTYGGVSTERARSIVQTSDGGYALAGDKDVGYFDYDFWLVKVDSSGTMEWDQEEGLVWYDLAYSLVQTDDGGYAVAGYNLLYNHADMGLYKFNSSGNYEWWETYGGGGGGNNEYALSLVQTNDGGYALIGNTGSFGAGLSDYWLVKTDTSGNMQWNKTYGGTGNDVGWSVVQTSDGGYMLGGYTDSFGAGGGDFWLVKTDEFGNHQWNKTYGGNAPDGGYSVVQTSDGGYIVAGYTESFGAGNSDFYLVKTDVNGNMQWNKTYGGTGYEGASSVILRSDGGYAMAGNTDSFGAGDSDFWVVKADANGNMQWNSTYGGTGQEVVGSIIETNDKGYALVGYTNSYGAGSYDFWLIKLAAPVYIGDVYIRADGSIDPPEAPILSLDNVTYTITCNINGSVVIQRNNTIIEGDGHTIQGSGYQSGSGVFIYNRIENVTVQNMSIKNFHFGIHTGDVYTLGNTICGNNITNNYIGIQLHVGYHSIFRGNNIANNSHGFYLYGAWNCTFSENSIAHNSAGVTLIYCAYDRFYHNNFIDNEGNAWQPVDDYTNFFDNGYPSGGNYWSNYNGSDFFRGPYQNETGSDGIGDTPYVVDENSIDNYPLMDSLGDFLITSVRPIQVIAEPKALIANKSTVAQVDIFSTFMEDKKAKINVTYNFGTRTYTEKGRNGDGVIIKPGLNRLYLPGGPIYEKQGEAWEVRDDSWSPPEGDDFFLKWTSTGTDNNIKVIIDPGNVIVELNENNNEMTVSKNIAESKSLRVLIVPVYFPELDQAPKTASLAPYQKEFLLSTFPVADDKFDWYVSPPMPFYSPNYPPPYLGLLFYIWLYSEVGIPITNMAKTFGYDRAVIVIHDLGQSRGGFAPGMVFSIPHNRVPVFVDDGFFGEWFVAHEMGHTYYLQHPHDAGPDTYDAWQHWVAEKSYLEYSRTFMSYASKLPLGVPSNPVWIDKGRYDSDSKAYRGFPPVLTWNLFDQLTVTQAGMMALSGNSEVIAISFDLFKNNTAQIDSSWHRLSKGELDLDAGSSGNYSIVMLDGGGQIINRIGFNATFTCLQEINETLTIIDTEVIPYAFNIPYVAGTTLIEIRNATDHVLGSRALSDNAPSTNVTFPNGGETLVAGMNYTISWTGFDFDADNLTYTLAYSKDGGKNWVPLAIELNQTSYVWDTCYLQQGSDYLVKVIATDGVNTGEDVSDSTFTVNVHDVATVNITSSKTIVGQGYSLGINVTVANEGDFTENFNVTVYANTTAIQTLNVTNLPLGNSTTVTFTWNTTGFAKGNYTISANATIVLGETDTGDNSYTDGQVRVNMPGDVAPVYDLVDIVDVVYVALHFGTEKGDPNYLANADLNCDGIIDIVDIVIIAIHFGETDP